MSADDLPISDEVRWYLTSRGIPLPWQVPAIVTPEPVGVPGARFDPVRVDRVLATFGALRHTKTDWAGRPLIPEPWQVAYLLAPTFGWVQPGEHQAWVRIIRSLWADLARKNGKSTFAGGVLIHIAFADGEQGAEVYTLATSERQAGFVFDPIRILATKSPMLKRHVVATKRRVAAAETGSWIAVVASVADGMHGASPAGGAIDEVHLHKSPDLIEAVESGTGARSQPLLLFLSTADDGSPGTIYARRRHFIEAVAAGTIADPSSRGVIFAADPDMDPFAESTMEIANPNIDVSVSRDFLRTEANKARQDPLELAKYLRLHLGIRTKQATRYITLPEWDRSAGMVAEEQLRGRVAYGGLDLGNVSDLTSLCWLFPDEHGSYDAVWRFWLPGDQVPGLNRRTAGAMDQWIRQGLVEVTPGATTDYDFVLAQLRRDLDRFDVREVGFDPWNSNQLTKQADADGAPLVEVRQGYGSLTGPLKECKRLLAASTPQVPLLRHGGNPVVRWMTDNLAVTTDAAGNVKPDKSKAADKIDGWSALVTAMNRAMGHKPARKSAYADHGLIIA